VITFLSVFPPYRGGIAKFSDYLYKHLTKTETVKAYNFSKLYPPVLFPGKSQKLDVEIERYAEPILHSYNPFNWNLTARKIAADKPEFVIYSFWHPFFVPCLYQTLKHIKKKNPEIRLVGVAHNILPHENFPFGQVLSKKLFDLTDHLILLSQQTEQEFHELHPNTEYTKLFHPVYEQPYPPAGRKELRKKYGVAERDHVLLFFGLVRKYKGLDLLIEALNQIDLESLHIKPFVVGEFYTNKQDLLNKIHPSKMDQYTIIDRFISEEEVSEIFTLSDLMVLPYKTASQSGVLSNAINFQLPVLVSNLPGLTEHIDTGETGLIFKTENPTALRDQILDFVQKDMHDKISNNLSSLKGALSWEIFTNELLKILKNI